MYLKVLETSFIITGILLIFFLSFRTYISSKINDNLKVSSFISFIAVILLLYVILSILLAIFEKNIIYKFLMIFFAVSPFVIGKLVTYEKVKFYSIMHIFIAAISVVCVYLF